MTSEMMKDWYKDDVFLSALWMMFGDSLCIISNCIMTNDECMFSNTPLTYIIMMIGSGTGMHVGVGMKYVAYRSWIGRTVICANDVNWCECYRCVHYDVCILWLYYVNGVKFMNDDWWWYDDIISFLMYPNIC